MPHRRSVSLSLAVILGCGPAAGGLPTEGPAATGIRAIHIIGRGAELPRVVRAGALGAVFVDVLVEDATGTLHPRGDRRVTWGSTNPAVADGGVQPGAAYIYLNRNGEARIIAHLDGLRDTVTFEVAQVAVAARLVADTVVTLAPDAVDLGGGPPAYHSFRYAAVRVDSNGYTVSSAEPLHFDPGPDELFDVAPEPRGDTVAILGKRVGVGRLVISLGDAATELPVQVADAYRVVRLIETPSGALRTLPDTVRIPEGAAVIFQNETRSTVMVDSPDSQYIAWRAGPIQPNGRQAQLFSRAGTLHYGWHGGAGVIIVTR